MPEAWGKTRSYYVTARKKVEYLDLPQEEQRIQEAKEAYRRIAKTPSYLLGAVIVQILSLPRRALGLFSGAN